MEKFENIIPTMIGQHRILQKDLGLVAMEITTNKEPRGAEILKYLNQFKKDLMEHLQLENDVFYVELFKRMEKSGEDADKMEIIEGFIEEMKKIGGVVVVFLGKYETAENIDNAMEDFKAEFFPIVKTLNTRLRFEESQVYTYWDLYE
jgi:iron-sulfur cluster repair protein YtfE (RIC family)